MNFTIYFCDTVATMGIWIGSLRANGATIVYQTETATPESGGFFRSMVAGGASAAVKSKKLLEPDGEHFVIIAKL